MTDAHQRFAAWLADATPGDPPRDLALHASGCTECLALASGLDALARVDPGLAPMPPLHLAPGAPSVRLAPVARAIGGMAAAGLFGLVLVTGGTLRGDPEPVGSAPPNEGVLGAVVGESSVPPHSRSPQPSPSDAVTPEPEESPRASATDQESAAPRPLTPVTPPPPPAPPGGPTSAPQPTAAPPTSIPSPTPPTPSPMPPPPSPTPQPTPTPTPPPTPTPTPTPTPDPTLLPSPLP